MRENELRKAVAHLFAAGEQFNWIVGRLGALNGSGGYDIEVPGRPNHVYVSLGAEGELGQTTAVNKGAALTAWRELKMRRENDQLVIRAADNLDSTVDSIAELLDVTLTGLANGNALQYDSGAGKWINVVPAGGAGGAPSPHDLDGTHHGVSTLSWAKVNKTGSSLADLTTRAHSALTGVGANDHHNQQHALVGSDHTASGLTTGHLLTATGAAAFGFASPLHNITDTGYHSITGSALQVVGATAANTLGLLTPSSAPGAASAILKTDIYGGIQLDTNVWYVDAANNRNGINRIPGGAALDVVANANADHTLRVTQKSGQIGRLWRVEDVSGNELIVLDSQGNLQSGYPGFVSGLTGWQISHTGTAEFNNVWVRGELHATVFVKDEVHATGGTMLVASAGKMYADAMIDAVTVDSEELTIVSTAAGWTGTTLTIVSTAAAWTGTTLAVAGAFNYLQIEDPPSGPGFYFADGDVIRSKTEVATGVTDFWFTVINAHQYDGYSQYSVKKESGTDGVLPAGAAVVSYGQEGDGRILLTSDLNYAPYQDVFTVGPEPWSGLAGAIIPHVRLGRLDGVGVTGTSGIVQYGMIAGTDLSDANSPYLIASNLQLRLHKIDLTANDGVSDTVSLTSTGNLTLGTNIANTVTTSFKVETTGANAGDVTIGQVLVAAREPNYLHWDQSEGVLHVKGDLLINGSTYALQTDLDTTNTTVGNLTTTVNNNHTIALNASTNAYNNALAEATSYANSTRILGVTGSWASILVNHASWGSVTPVVVRFANGSSKTITAGSVSGFTGRRYLYVVSAATSPLTMLNTADPSVIGSTHTLIAVVDEGAAGSGAASITVVAGSTYISGGNIWTGSIVTNSLAAGAVTAVKLVGEELSALKAFTGSLSVTGTLTMGTSGKIISTGKDGYANTTAGFFMGWDTDAYKLDIGTTAQHIRWNGSSLNLALLTPLQFNVSGSVNDGIFANVTNLPHGAYIKLSTTGSIVVSASSDVPDLSADRISSVKTVLTGDTFQIATARTPATFNATGIKGEICWDSGFIYVCIATNSWKRVVIDSLGW